MTHAADAFVGEIDRDAQPCFFDEPTLDFVQDVAVIDVFDVFIKVPDAVAVFVDIADAVFPDAGFPFLGGTRVFEDAFETVDGAHLCGFFIHVHLPQQIGDAFIDGQFWIFVGILFPVFVSIDPRIVVQLRFFFLSRDKAVGD